MSIVVRDETAGANVLTIDNNGNVALGNGTPINMLTLNGVGIIDSNGHILSGANSSTANISSGTGTLGVSSQMQFNTVPGRQPNVQLDTSYPSVQYFMDFQDPSNPSAGGSESVSPVYGRTQCGVAPIVGGLVVFNNDFGDGYVTDPSSEYYDPTLKSEATFVYRWI